MKSLSILLVVVALSLPSVHARGAVVVKGKPAVAVHQPKKVVVVPAKPKVKEVVVVNRLKPEKVVVVHPPKPKPKKVVVVHPPKPKPKKVVVVHPPKPQPKKVVVVKPDPGKGHGHHHGGRR